MQFSFYFGTDLTDLPQPPLHRITAPLQVVGAIVGAHCGKALRGGFMRWRWGATKLRRVRRCLLLTGRLALTSAADRLTCSFARWRRGAAKSAAREKEQRSGSGLVFATVKKVRSRCRHCFCSSSHFFECVMSNVECRMPNFDFRLSTFERLFRFYHNLSFF